MKTQKVEAEVGSTYRATALDFEGYKAVHDYVDVEVVEEMQDVVIEYLLTNPFPNYKAEAISFKVKGEYSVQIGSKTQEYYRVDPQLPNGEWCECDIELSNDNVELTDFEEWSISGGKKAYAFKVNALKVGTTEIKFIPKYDKEFSRTMTFKISEKIQNSLFPELEILKLTKKQLQDLLTENNIEFDETATKDELLKLLETAD